MISSVSTVLTFNSRPVLLKLLLSMNRVKWAWMMLAVGVKTEVEEGEMVEDYLEGMEEEEMVEEDYLEEMEEEDFLVEEVDFLVEMEDLEEMEEEEEMVVVVVGVEVVEVVEDRNALSINC